MRAFARPRAVLSVLPGLIWTSLIWTSLIWTSLIWANLIWANAVFDAAAQRLPLRTYSTADGLAGDHITSILPDSRGFIAEQVVTVTVPEFTDTLSEGSTAGSSTRM